MKSKYSNLITMFIRKIFSEFFLPPIKLYRVRYVSYVQGQEPEPKIREYFYYIDHQGMALQLCTAYNKLDIAKNKEKFLKYYSCFLFQLFLDDSKMKNFTSCFKEKKFLEFFFKRIRLNKTGRYEEHFPFISLCGRERNFIRCDDVPIVFTHIIATNESDFLVYGYTGDLLKTVFKPEKVYMLPETGRVYHPADDKYGGVGLVRSKLAIEISKNFTFDNGELKSPTHFTWRNKIYQLDQLWFHDKLQTQNIKIKSISD